MTRYKSKEGFQFYSYFDSEHPGFITPLKKLIELEFIYKLEFTSDEKNIDNIRNGSYIKNIYF